MNTSSLSDNGRLLIRFIERVWNAADLDAVDELVADEYTVHSDPGDPWDGRTLTREGFKERLTTSRSPFPDLRFDLDEVIAEGDRVVLSWVMRGTQTGSMAGRPASGLPIAVHGMTIYYVADGRITGHRQVVDRLAVAQQLHLLG